jgi:hypothetical protein
MPKGVYPRPLRAPKICSVQGCDKPVKAVGLCSAHDSSQRKYGRLEKLPAHGATAGGKRSSEFVVWAGMIERCTSPGYHHWSSYGGRGIKVHESWLKDFAAFFADVGPRPSLAHSLDRYPNNDGNYEPGNVRWATAKEQAANRRTNITVEFQGELVVLAEAARRAGISKAQLSKRYQRGLRGDALFAPPRASLQRSRRHCAPVQAAKQQSSEGSNACR